MIELIRKRFMRVSMLSSGIILITILALINILNYFNTVNRMDSMLENQNYVYAGKGNNNLNATRNTQQNAPKKSVMGNQRNKVFYIEVTADEQLLNYNLDNSPFIDVEDVVALGQEALKTEDYKGFIEDFRYSITVNNDVYHIAFVDAQSELYTLQYNLIFSFIVYLLGMIGIFFLVKALTIPAVKPIEDSYNKQKRFLTDIMHEIKTPLAIIETDSEVVEIDYGKNEWTKSIKKQIHYLKDLLDELVTLLKMDEHSEILKTSRVNVSELLENSITGFEPLFNRKGLNLNLMYDEKVEINSNEESIEKLISIILENALKYTSGENKISVVLKKVNKKILFEVENSMKNIDPGNHEEFFDRFYRSDLSRNSELGGHGIGLSMAKEIVTQNKGQIKAFSKNNHSFTISVIM
ncbi:MAG: sensor histidine kinase [Sphaerochaeta sp.]